MNALSAFLGSRVERFIAPSPGEGAPALSARRFWSAFLAGAFLALPFALNFALCNSLDRDEHQHIAAGVLFARDGLIPYRDFAYFHVPYLVWLYGGVFQFTDHYLLASRLLSALFAAMTAGAVFGAAWCLFSAKTFGKRVAIALGATLALLSVPLFTEVVGYSWNQEPSLLFLVLAFMVLLSVPPRSNAGWHVVIAGVMTGIAAGFRVTILPMVLPLAIMAWLSAPAGKLRWRFLVLFAVGLSVGMLPLVVACVLGPKGFFFGNVEFPKVAVVYRWSTGEPRTMTLLKKLRFLFKSVMSPNWLLFYSFIALVLAAKLWFKQRLCANRPLLFVFMALPFLLIGAIAPSPVFDQYFYPFAPFLVIGSLAVLATFPKVSAVKCAAWIGVSAALGVSAFCSFDQYDSLSHFAEPGRWAVVKTRAAATEIRAAVGEGKVLTLAPALPLEAGLSIYPELVTGPFAWRIAPFVQHDRHHALHLLAPDDLESYLGGEKPAAILTGLDKRGEKQIVRYADAHGYRKMKLTNGMMLWVVPKVAR